MSTSESRAAAEPTRDTLSAEIMSVERVARLQRIYAPENFEADVETNASLWGAAIDLQRIYASHELLRAQLAEAEKAVGEEVDNRDLFEEQINAIYAALGGENEWSSEHDLGDEALELAEALRAQVAEAARENVSLKNDQRAFVLAIGCDPDVVANGEALEAANSIWREMKTLSDKLAEASRDREPTFDLNEFSAENRARCEAPNGFNHRMDSWSLSDWMTATLGELGEAANVAKKLNRVRDGIVGNSETERQLRAKLGSEIADAFIYLDLLAQSQGLRLSEIVRRTFDAKSAQIGYAVSRVPLSETKRDA